MMHPNIIRHTSQRIVIKIRDVRRHTALLAAPCISVPQWVGKQEGVCNADVQRKQCSNAPSCSNAALAELPLDLLREVLAFLPAPSLAHAAVSCRNLKCCTSAAAELRMKFMHSCQPRLRAGESAAWVLNIVERLGSAKSKWRFLKNDEQLSLRHAGPGVPGVSVHVSLSQDEIRVQRGDGERFITCRHGRCSGVERLASATELARHHSLALEGSPLEELVRQAAPTALLPGCGRLSERWRAVLSEREGLLLEFNQHGRNVLRCLLRFNELALWPAASGGGPWAKVNLSCSWESACGALTAQLAAP